MLVWFIVAYSCLARGIGTRVFPLINPFIEISVPTGVIIIDIFTQGAHYAATSGLPLQLYGMMTASVVLRVRPLLPLVVSAVGALEYAWVVTAISPGLGGGRLVESAYVLSRQLRSIRFTGCPSAHGCWS